MSEQRNRNPYEGIDWNRVRQIAGCTHMHCTSAGTLNQYLADGLEFVTLSNYYPSAPWYPLSEIRENTFRCRQKGYITGNTWIKDTLDLNQTIAAWQKDLPEAIRSQLPFCEGEKLFPGLPENLLEAPNAEHHWFSDAGIWLHITAPGSCISSGTFDIQGQFGLAEHGFPLGAPLPWRTAFQKIFDSLLYPDGGGIVIAHPAWSHLPPEFIMEMLDSDSRVLGIEVYNHDSRGDFADFSDSTWDAILSTGRQCYGFFVQDHPTPDKRWQGRIILLPEEQTAESCLKALRKGHFYGAILGSGLRFEYLNFDGHTLKAVCNHTAQFQLISRTGVIGDMVSGTEFCYELPEAEQEKHDYLRLTAKDGYGGEKLFAQPFLL